MTERQLRVDVHLAPDHFDTGLREDALAGLTSTPKSLPSKWLYDARGSELFDAITRLPEYYPTNAERSILSRAVHDIAVHTDVDTLIELGSGTSEKTRVLLDGLTRDGRLRRFVPFDVSEETLRLSATQISQEYPGLDVHGIVGDFGRHLELLPRGGRRLVAFLGGTMGNLHPAERLEFLTSLGRGLEPDDAVLLGVDLVKHVDRLVAAYDDAAGVTASFTLNLLRVLNRELGASFDPDRFEHDARWNPQEEWMELSLRSTEDQIVPVDALGLKVPFAAGELMRTEISAKFRLAGLREELAAAGLELDMWWTDQQGDFLLLLAGPPQRT